MSRRGAFVKTWIGKYSAQYDALVANYTHYAAMNARLKKSISIFHEDVPIFMDRPGPLNDRSSHLLILSFSQWEKGPLNCPQREF